MEESANHIPLRILMTTDTVGGVWSYSVELCKALLPFGVQFYLITTGAPLQLAQKREIEQLNNVTVYETNFLLEWMENPWQSIDDSAAWLLALEEKLQPDIIHINGYVYGSLPWKAPVMVVAHSDVYSWWRSVKGTTPTQEWSTYFERVREGLNGADYLIAPSQWMLQAVQQIYGTTVPGKVIYNGRDTASFSPAQKQPYIFSMGRIWDEAKNIQLLVQAAAQINYSIRLAGDNHFAANTMNVEGTSVQYLGKLSTAEVAAQLASASVYVLPAKYEPFGLSILEAALSSCALVLGEIDSLKELWNDAAIFVDTDDADALAIAVNNLMENEALRNQYAQAARKQALKYNTATMAEKYWNVYSGLLQRKQQLVQPEII